MPSPYDHLTAAEELLHDARQLLTSGRLHAAEAHSRVALGFLEAASARQQIIPDPAPMPAARRGPLPDWCGQCDGPDIALRWIQVTDPRDESLRMAKCPVCHPSASPRPPAPSEADRPAGPQLSDQPAL